MKQKNDKSKPVKKADEDAAQFHFHGHGSTPRRDRRRAGPVPDPRPPATRCDRRSAPWPATVAGSDRNSDRLPERAGRPGSAGLRRYPEE